MIASPCVGVCALDAATGLCRGCARTRDEVARWSAASDTERRAILARLVVRGLADPPALRHPGGEEERGG
jgi:hypothetical protein